MLANFNSDEFDYVLIDEAHRAAAPSYQRLLHYFKPNFWLGMTATPERMDEQNIYQIFDYNLAYEIRLRDALEEKMLAPFHYVGVQDYEADGVAIDETTDLPLPSFYISSRLCFKGIRLLRLLWNKG